MPSSNCRTCSGAEGVQYAEPIIQLTAIMKTVINLVILGSLKRPIDFKYLQNWKTSLFLIDGPQVRSTLPDMLDPSAGYSDGELSRLIRESAFCHVTVGLINAPIQDNFYQRALGQRSAVISLYQMDEIIRSAQHRLEDFILRCLYTIVLARIECGGVLDMAQACALSHDEIRSCLFDMNTDKADVLYSLDPPILCSSCKTRLTRNQLDHGFIPALDRELRRIRKPLYYRISGWAKNHPISSLVITSLFALTLNFVGNALYDLAKAHFTSKQLPSHAILGTNSVNQMSLPPQDVPLSR